MSGSSSVTERSAAASRRDSVVVGDPTRLARALSQLFAAPVGVIDPSGGRWLAWSGAGEGAFPMPEESLLRSLASHQGPGARIELWRPDPSATFGTETVWLLLPASQPSGRVIAAAGFATNTAGSQSGPVAWGTPCPEPALAAWGREVCERLRASESRTNAQAHPAPIPSRSVTGGSEGGDGVILARLIRRMRLSDAPEKFQQLACTALRNTMNVAAVAWIPCHHEEIVVASGEVGAFSGEGYRSLLPPEPHTDAVRIWNDPSPLGDPDIHQAIAAAADAQRPAGWLVAINTLDGRSFQRSDGELLQPVASVITTQANNSRGYADLKELLFGVIRSLTAAIDAKDPYTSGHSERVARIAVRLAEELNVPAAQRSDLYLMGLLHDVGKIGVDDAVLKKAGPLTPDEYRQIQKHVEMGVQILSDLKKLNHLLPGVKHHHESLDGTGYPCGLAGDAIPFEARILAVADSYDAMSSSRPYRRRLSPSQIDEIFQKGSGIQWDPRIVDAMFACRMDLEMIRQKGLGDSLQVAVSGALGRT